MRLEGRVAIVTGAAQGIGAVYAKALASEGALICAADIVDPASTVGAIIDSGGRAVGTIVDITDPLSVRAMVEATVAEFGELHILVNNAALFGALKPGPFDQISSADWDRVMSVNTRGPFECIKAAIPHLRRSGGAKIVNVASTTPYMGQPMMLHYVTSKGAIIALTHALARELGNDGICVNALAPGLTMSDAVRNSFTQDRVDANVAVRALKREQMPEDLVGGLIFLASRESDFMTGQTLVIDGGVILK